MKPFRRATDLLALFAIVIAGQGSAQLMTQFSSSVKAAIDRRSGETEWS
jgi:hypothetical protein